MKNYLFLLIYCCIGSTASAETFIDSIVAVVNTDAITQSELQDELRIAALTARNLTSTPTEAEHRAALETLIHRRFVLQEAERLGIVITDPETQIAAQIADIAARYRSEPTFPAVLAHLQLEQAALEATFYNRLVYDEFFRRIFFNTVNSEKVASTAKAYYDANRTEFIVPPTVTFKSLEITLPKWPSTAEQQRVEAQLQKLNDRLQRGDTFQAVYDAYQTTLTLTFDVQTLAVGTPIGSRVTELQVSERSQPFAVPNGYRIVERIRNDPSYQRTYEEVREMLTLRVRTDLATTALESWLTERKAAETWHVLTDGFTQDAYQTEATLKKSK